MEEEILLSVIIISRNIEMFINRCIEAVLEATKHIEKKEIILVDSASTDGTVERAKRYPIKILRISSSAPLSAAAGRYVGYLHARGWFIHFQDGDSILCKGWFKEAIPFLEKQEDVAGVVGRITQEDYDNPVTRSWIKGSKNQSQGHIDDYREGILIRREVLDEVGSFNPWLRAKEEGEFAVRILSAGHSLYRLNIGMSHHIGGEYETYIGLMKRKIISTYVLGRILRYHLKNKPVRNIYIKRQRPFILISITYPLLVLSLIPLYLYGTRVLLYLSIGLLLVAMIDFFNRQKNIPQAILGFFSMSMRWPILVLGFFRPMKEPMAYDAEIDIIKDVRRKN